MAADNGGNTRLSRGASYTRHEINSNRSVAFPGFIDSLSAEYAAGTAQAFGEMSHKVNLGEVSLTPYAGFDYVRRHPRVCRNRRGRCAQRSGQQPRRHIATLGFGAQRVFLVRGTPVTAKGKLGWRHAFAGTVSSLRSFSNRADFAVFGAPIGRFRDKRGARDVSRKHDRYLEDAFV